MRLTHIADPIVCIDHVEQAVAINSAMESDGSRVRAVIEMDIGLQRVGVEPGEPTLELARQVSQLDGIQLVGLMAYEGHLLTIADVERKAMEIQRAVGRAVETRRLLESHGMACPIMSCGGTGSYVHTVTQPGITELQAGGAIFMDVFYREKCQVDQLDNALTVTSTITSRPTTERAIIDAGRKTLNAEIHMPRIYGRDDVEVQHLSAEHGILKLHGAAKRLKIGDRIELVPGYADLTVNLHDQFVAFRQQRVAELIPIEARGKLQ